LDLPQHLHLKDIRAMLEDNADSWLHQWEAQGIQKGLQEGLQKGLQEGLQKGLQAQQDTLARLIRHKFGKLPNARRQQLSTADSRQLTAWSLQLLDANTLDEVFQPSASRPRKSSRN